MMGLEALFQPNTVAVCCDASQLDDPGRLVASHLLSNGFSGNLVLVDGKGESMLGRSCLKDPRDSVEKIDLAILTSSDNLLQNAERMVMAGVKAMVVSAEIPKEDSLLHDVVSFCQKRQVRLLGPGSLGVMNLHEGLNASLSDRVPPKGSVALLSDSSALARALMDEAGEHSVGLSKVIDLGEKADLNELDFFKELRRDDQTQVVMGYLESLASGTRFLERAEALTNAKPVIIFKSATTRSGKKAAAVQAGRSLGTEVAYGAAFKRSGVIRAESLESLFDSARAFALLPRPKGDRVAIVSNAYGPGIMAADALEKQGLSLAELDGFRGTTNPIRLPDDATPEVFAEVLEALQRLDTVDQVFLLVAPRRNGTPTETAFKLVESNLRQKPLVTVFLGGKGLAEARLCLSQGGLADFPTPDRAAFVLAAMWEYTVWQRRPQRMVTRFPVNRRRVERIIRRHERQGLSLVEEYLARQILEAYAFSIPAGCLVTHVDQALDAADRFGYPIILKLVSTDVVDKKALGGIRPHLTTPDQVRDAFDLIQLRMQRHRPNAQLEGIYVEKSTPQGLELVLGMTRDPQFGPMLMFGHGGVFMETLDDVAFHLAPITADEALLMLRTTKSFRLLEERKRDLNIESIITGLQRISQLATDFPVIRRLEINPFVVYRPGKDSLANGASIEMAFSQATKGL
jgi:acetyltransferase